MSNTLKKTPSSGKSLIRTHSIFWGLGGERGWGWGGHLFEFSVGVGGRWGGVGWGGVGAY